MTTLVFANNSTVPLCAAQSGRRQKVQLPVHLAENRLFEACGGEFGIDCEDQMDETVAKAIRQ